MTRSNSNYSYTLDNEVLGIPFTGKKQQYISDDDDYDDDTLAHIDHLPLRANFADISDEWDSSFPETPSNGFGSSMETSLTASMTNLNLNLNINSMKKVRFNNSFEDSSVILSGLQNKRKPNVEQLIESATSMNDYVEENLNKINEFRNKFYHKNGMYNSTSNNNSMDNLGIRSHLGSTSNFELSDTETCPLPEEEEDTVHYNMNDNIDFSSMLSQSNENKQSAQDELNSNVRKYAALKQVPGNSNNNIDNIDLYKQVYEYDPSHLVKINEILIDDAIKYFITTIEQCLILSPSNIISSSNKRPDLSSFKMKSLPSVSYHALINRIQKKCEFEPIIFLQSIYLLQVLLLTHDNNNTIRFKTNLEECHIHRLIIALIRISCKLLQDKQYSHEYFSKVCGITKRLLTKLEVSLMIAVRDNGLMARNRDLLNAVSTVTKLQN